MERRHNSRHLCEGTALVSPIGAQPQTEWPAVVQDLSRRGISLKLKRRFEPRAMLVVEWQLGERSTPRFFLGRVVRVAQQEDLGWLHGCTLLGELTCAELLGLLAKAPRARRALAASRRRMTESMQSQD
jgi:hypothetical protein